MEAVEVNAGAWYLRALRDDDRLSDVPALTLLGVDRPAEYVAATDRGWADESQLTWAVCVPTTGELAAVVAEVSAYVAADTSADAVTTADNAAPMRSMLMERPLHGLCRFRPNLCRRDAYFFQQMQEGFGGILVQPNSSSTGGSGYES